MMTANGECPNCGSPLHGDGYKTVLHCEMAEQDDYWNVEPDAAPVYCRPTEEDKELERRRFVEKRDNFGEHYG